MVLFAILFLEIVAVFAVTTIFNWKNGKRTEEIFNEIRSMSDDTKSMKAAMRIIAENTEKTSAMVEQMMRRHEEEPDEQAAKRAKEEIDRFNTGIANILSYGTDEKDGDRK